MDVRALKQLLDRNDERPRTPTVLPPSLYDLAVEQGLIRKDSERVVRGHRFIPTTPDTKGQPNE